MTISSIMIIFPMISYDFPMISHDFPMISDDFPSFPLGFGQFSQGLALHEAHPGALGASPQRTGALLRAHTQKLRDALDSAGKNGNMDGKWLENGWKMVGHWEYVENNMKKWRNMGNQTNWDWNLWKKIL